MVADQHKKITGYRDLSEAEIADMNAIKRLEAMFNGLIDHLKARGATLNQEQVTLAAQHGEDAFMHAVRAVAQPHRTVLPFDEPKDEQPINQGKSVT